MAMFQVNFSAATGVAAQKEMSGQTTICSLRSRLYGMTGFTPESMKISVDGKLVEDELMTLAQLATSNVINITVTGKAEFEFDDPTVEKYELSDADYDSRKGTIRELKRKMGIAVKGEVPEVPPEGFEPGMRCEGELADGSKRRGEVKYVGKLEGMKGFWIGIQLDEPWGKNDGSCKGTSYFKCDENYGIFLRASKTQVGDFPEIDWEDELADEM